MEDEEWLKLGVAAAMAKAYAADQRGFIEGLARTLGDAMPGQVRVTRGGGLFGLGRAVREISLQLRECRLSLKAAPHGSVVAQRTLSKRGIDLRTDDVPVESWIQEVAEAVQEHARESGEAAAALRRFVG